ncbi:hypothetical protein [Mycoplasma suis]|uniref:Uncharacterized protein n=1 Tax=Mycoplasma suis (strain Illinois) TaxID=768700 RepID=F0QQL0_MYCSL|nr:hypothetical protein [Mycoplasma suis]ADX97780.1 hypothetical protein MSU_0236 [Mycoplasma suis str. Illinois]
MGLLALSKLTVSLSTVGGALLGSYFAVPSLLAGENGSTNPTVPELSKVSQNVGSVDSLPLNQQPSNTPEQGSQGAQETEKREELGGVEAHKETSPTPEKEGEGQILNSSLTRSDEKTKDRQEDNWRNIEFSDDTLKNEDTTIKEIDGLGGNESNDENVYLSDSEESEEDKEEIEEELQSFEYYEDDYSDEEDEEGTTNTRLNVAKYIKKVGDDLGNSVCENWMRGSGVNIKKLVDQESCKNEVRGKRWNRKGDSEQPTVWLESELSQTKKLLLEYGLWTEGHQFRSDSNSKWDIEHKENSGLQWSCKREISLDERDFWISCDLFQKSH